MRPLVSPRPMPKWEAEWHSHAHADSSFCAPNGKYLDLKCFSSSSSSLALLSPGRLWMVPIWSDDHRRWAGLEPPHLEVKLDQRLRSQEAHRLPNELGHEHQALEISRQSLEGRGQKSHTNGLSERIHFLSPCLLGISKKMNRDWLTHPNNSWCRGTTCLGILDGEGVDWGSAN